MPGCLSRRAALAGVLALAGCAGAFYETNLDVPEVATPQPVVDEMLRLGNVNGDDYLVDLGSGDGRIVVTAARRFGTRGLGVDLNPQLVELSIQNAREAGVADRVEFRRENIFETDISRATVVTLYLLPAVNEQLQPKLMRDLRPGTRIVAHDFGIGNWQPDVATKVPGEGSPLFLWIVPASVDGTWVSEKPDDAGWAFSLRQQYQYIGGTASNGQRDLPLTESRLNGEQVTLAVAEPGPLGTVTHHFAGRVQGDIIEGERWTDQTGAARRPWRARRLPI